MEYDSFFEGFAKIAEGLQPYVDIEDKIKGALKKPKVLKRIALVGGVGAAGLMAAKALKKPKFSQSKEDYNKGVKAYNKRINAEMKKANQ